MLITDDLCRFDALIRSTIATIIIIAAVRIRMNRPRKSSGEEKEENIELVIGSECSEESKNIKLQYKQHLKQYFIG
jgi:hypothetical protein